MECSWHREYFGFLVILKETWSIHDTRNNQKFILLPFFTFIYKYLKYELIYNLGEKTFFYLIINRINGLLEFKTEKWNSQCKQGQPMEPIVLHVQMGYGSVLITLPVSLLVNEFNVRSVLHSQVRLASVNQKYVFHEAMNICKNLTIHKRLAFKM